MTHTETSAEGEVADRVVVSFRAPEADPAESDSWWVADRDWLSTNMNDETYRRYLRRAHEGPVAVGDEWEEAVNCGCARPEDVLLRVERVDGGAAIGEGTEIAIVARKAVVEGDGLADALDE